MRDINLLPWREQLARRQTKYFFITLIISWITIVIIIILLRGYFLLKVKQITVEQQYLQEKIKQWTPAYKISQQQRQQQEKIQQKQNFWLHYQRNNQMLLRFLQSISKYITGNLYLEQIAKIGSELQVNGYASNYTEIVILLQRLKEIAEFNIPQLIIAKVNASQAQKILFKIKVLMNDKF